MVNDALFALIKTLSKSEKRHFKLWSTRQKGSQEKKYIQLFRTLDKMDRYQEELILKRVPSIKKAQLSNQKAHLYKQLLLSLRLQHKEKEVEIQIREQIDYAQILFKKGLYLQSLKILDRLKHLAKAKEKPLLQLEILAFEKLIESRYITRSIKGRAESLTSETERVILQIGGVSQLSNLNLMMYGLYIEKGHIQDEEEVAEVQAYFERHLPERVVNEDRFFEKYYWYTSHAWYHYILQDWLNYYRNCKKWTQLFEESPEVKAANPVMYMKGMHNVLNGLFIVRDHFRYLEQMTTLEVFVETHQNRFDKNTEIRAFLYLNFARINRHFMEGTFGKGLELVPTILQGLKEYNRELDNHRKLVFQYKIACCYFGTDDHETAIQYLNQIINQKATNLRSDIQCYARMLHLIGHFDLGHYGLIQHLAKNVYRVPDYIL
ncbi:MAG: hypothetical protein AAFV80_10860, partial [Bacteroidota bacterium]